MDEACLFLHIESRIWLFKGLFDILKIQNLKGNEFHFLIQFQHYIIKMSSYILFRFEGTNPSHKRTLPFSYTDPSLIPNIKHGGIRNQIVPLRSHYLPTPPSEQVTSRNRSNIIIRTPDLVQITKYACNVSTGKKYSPPLYIAMHILIVSLWWANSFD